MSETRRIFLRNLKNLAQFVKDLKNIVLQKHETAQTHLGCVRLC